MDRLAGMAISRENVDGGSTHTLLVGLLQDQAALQGVFDTLYSLHLPILEVATIEDPSEIETIGH